MVATPTENKTEIKTSHLLGSPAEDLRLRVCTGSRKGLVIRIAADRCTIGSAPGCTLRLRHGQASPVHCLIARGNLGTLVRRWSADTLLNGAPFHDAALRSGDRLQCGPLELEILPDETTRPATDGSAAGEAAALRDEAAAEIEAFRARAQLARRRSRKLILALRAARGRSVQLEWQLEEEQSKHQTTQSRFDQQRRDAAQHAQTATDRLEDLGEQLEQSQTARNKLQSQLGAEQEIINQLRAQIVELRKELTEIKEDEAATATEPVTAEQEEQPHGAESGAIPADVSRETIPATPSGDDPASHDQRAIESYMADLLRRVSGSSVRTEHIEEMTATVESRVVREQIPAEEDPEPETATGDLLATPSAMRPRPPHETTNLTAMRELAKLSADQAMDQHLQQSRYFKAIGKLVVAAAGLVSGAALIAFRLFQGPETDVRLPRLIGTVAVLIGVVWGLQGTILMRKLYKREPAPSQSS